MYWQKQNINQPLFPDLFWDQPISQISANNFCLIGGSSTDFKQISLAYNLLQQKKYHQLYVILPNSLRKIFQEQQSNLIFAPSNQSGAFSLETFSLVEDLSLDSDILSMIGGFTTNSETIILIEKIINNINKIKVISHDAIIDTFQPNQTIAIVQFKNLQKLLKNFRYHQAVTSNIELTKMIQIINDFCQQFKLALITEFNQNLIAFYDNKVSLMEAKNNIENWETNLNILSSYYLANNYNKIFESITCAIYDFINFGAARRT